MYGRNGSDQLNMALLVVYLVIWVLGTILYRVTGSALLYSAVQAVMVVLAVLVLFRCFSKNLAKRRGENAKFLNWWYPVKSRFAGMKQRRADKAHKYFTCKTCKTICRVPVGKGKIEITCPKCGGKIKGKS
jgi:hypothetical protein